MRGTNKDAFYFSHDSNARDDIKCIELVGDLGLEGYGIYWVLIETLREQPGYTYPIKLLPALAKRFGSDPANFQKVVRDYDLFVVEDEKIFFSPSLKRRMQLYEDKKAQARQAGLKSGEKRAKNNPKATDVQQPFSGGSTTDEPKRVNNSKVNNIKVNESITPPSLSDILDYITANKFQVDANRFFNYYSARDWKNVPSWQIKVKQWEDEDAKKRPPAGVVLGVGESIDNGRRTYGTGKATIPMDALPRPSERHAWDSLTQKWLML